MILKMKVIVLLNSMPQKLWNIFCSSVKHLGSLVQTQHMAHKSLVCFHKPESLCAIVTGTPTNEHRALSEMKQENVRPRM